MNENATMEFDRPFSSPELPTVAFIHEEPHRVAEVRADLAGLGVGSISEGSVGDFTRRASLQAADVIYLDLSGVWDFPFDEVGKILRRGLNASAKFIVSMPLEILDSCFGFFSDQEAKILSTRPDPTELSRLVLQWLVWVSRRSKR